MPMAVSYTDLCKSFWGNPFLDIDHLLLNQGNNSISSAYAEQADLKKGQKELEQTIHASSSSAKSDRRI